MTSRTRHGALRLRSFAIQNFRTFRERTAIAFQPDVTVFHGDTGSGKSTALTAIDLFFRALALVLPKADGQFTLSWDTPVQLFGHTAPLIGERDRPVAGEPTVLAATFEHDPARWVEVRFEPLGPQVRVELAWASAPKGNDALYKQLFPFGGDSRPIAVLVPPAGNLARDRGS
ncbi:MAG: AAA family ATPase [Deltaproteobacteria bacterium]|nr:AAA family ATPase [Deltaproteobacteria bacterium]